jgi:hypothetical protein
MYKFGLEFSHYQAICPLPVELSQYSPVTLTILSQYQVQVLVTKYQKYYYSINPNTLLWYNGTITICRYVDSALAAGHCDRVLAIHLALLNELLADLLAQTDHMSLGINASHSTCHVISQISDITTQ